MSIPSTPTSPHDRSLGLRECAICQTAVFPGEQTTACPKCGLVYHAECWQHNLGCAAYGCDQVNVLAATESGTTQAGSADASSTPSADAATRAAPAEGVADDAIPPPAGMPWSFLLLGASAVAVAVSALTYGVPSLLVAIAVVARMASRRRYDRVLAAAGVLAIAGAVGGALLSRIWWAAE